MAKFGFSGDKFSAQKEIVEHSVHNSDDILLLNLKNYARKIMDDRETGDTTSGQITGYFYGCLDAVRSRLTENYNAHAALQPVAKIMQAIPVVHLDDTDYLARAVINGFKPPENPWLKLGPRL